MVPGLQLQPQVGLELQVERREADGRLAQQPLPPHARAPVYAHAEAEPVYVLWRFKYNCLLLTKKPLRKIMLRMSSNNFMLDVGRQIIFVGN